MDNLFSLTDQIAQDLNEETASSNISYIPGGFLKTKQAMIALATQKPKWSIEILESDNKFDVSFEDVLRISILKEHYDDFNNKVFNIKGLKEIDLSAVLNEATQEDTQTTVDNLTKALSVDLRDHFVVENSFYLSASWLRLFNGTHQPMPGKSLLSISEYESDVNKLIERIKLNYADDTGEMERAIEAIRAKTPLNDLDIFAGYPYLMGQVYISKYLGINMRFTCAINMAWQPVEEVWIESMEAVDELSYYRKYVKPLHNTLKPVNGFFTPTVFKAIADVIKDLTE